MPGQQLTFCFEALLVVGFVVFFPEFLEIVDLALDLCLTLLVFLLQTLNHQVFLSDRLLFKPGLSANCLQAAHCLLQRLLYVAGLCSCVL